MILNFFVSFPHRRLLATLVKTRLITITWIRFRQTVCWFGWIKPVPLVIATSMWRWVANPTLCTRTQAHARMHIYTQAHKHTHACTYTRKHTSTCTHARTHTHTTQARRHTHTTQARTIVCFWHPLMPHYTITASSFKLTPLCFFFGFFFISLQSDLNPTRTQFDYRDISFKQNVSISIPNPSDRTWYLGVYGYRSCQYILVAQTTCTY